MQSALLHSHLISSLFVLEASKKGVEIKEVENDWNCLKSQEKSEIWKLFSAPVFEMLGIALLLAKRNTLALILSDFQIVSVRSLSFSDFFFGISAVIYPFDFCAFVLLSNKKQSCTCEK